MVRTIDWLPTATTEKQDLETIAAFFGIDRTGKLMRDLTGASKASLSRVLNDLTERTEEWEHVATVAAYVRELRSLVEEASGGQTEPQGDMSRWLVTAHIPTAGGRALAIKALSDPTLAREALAGIRQVSW